MWSILLGKQKEHHWEVPVSQGWQSSSQGRLSHLLCWLEKTDSNQSQPWVCFQILSCPPNWLWRVSSSTPFRDRSPSLLPAWLCQVLPGTQTARTTFPYWLCSARSRQWGWSYWADAINSRRNTSLLRRVHLCWIMSSVSLRTELLLHRSQQSTNRDAALGTSYRLS